MGQAAGAIQNYKFKRKNDWRGWVYNRAIERLPVKPKDAVVLYLPGVKNIEGETAYKKGFRANNMIAVEKDHQSAIELRKHKVNCVNDDLHSVIYQWGKNPKIDFINADLCCGFTKSCFHLIQSIFYCEGLNKEKTVISVNLMRGRESLKVNGKSVLNSYKDFVSKCGGDTVHRGMIFYISFLMTIKNFLMETHSEEESISVCNCLNNFADPEFYSYRNESGKIFMDSVIFNFKPIVKENGLQPIKKNTKNNIASFKAIRTMKIKGVL